jgi:hypothetical protein
MSRLSSLITGLLMMLSGCAHPASQQRSITDAAASSANVWVSSLGSMQLDQGVFDFDDPLRLHWMFFPGDRAGLPLREMSDDQQGKLNALLETVLSPRGMDDLQGVYAMEVALGDEAQRRGRQDSSRDPDQYELAVFGTPGTVPWSWHYEGHHLSLNFTHVGEEVAVTPLFVGVAPFVIPDGALRGLQVLGDERTAAFALLGMLTESQRSRAIIADRVPGDVHTVPGREDRLISPKGVPLSDLDLAQRKQAMEILQSYAGILHGSLAAAELDRITAAGIEEIHFAWAGATTHDKGHYFRLHGPTFILEYDCIGGNTDHVHMVWHDADRNFGRDPLARHRDRHHQDLTAETRALQSLPPESGN